MRRGTATKLADAYACDNSEYKIFWAERGAWDVPDKRGVFCPCQEGWYVYLNDAGESFGPFATSQAAFCALKEGIDRALLTTNIRSISSH